MNARTILNWIGLSALAAYLGASQPAYAGTAAAVHVKAAGFAAPAPRARPKLGAAPKPQFKINNRTYNIDPKEKSVAAVRAMPPRNYEPATRSQSVEGFYRKQFADKIPAREKLANLHVGPFRREFIWWAWHSWALEDRAWWAWNNYAYFDQALWAQWMEDEEFKRLIARYDAEHHTRVAGFIPQQYASTSPEVIYNDEYIEAVYNPVYTTPSIVVDGSAGARLENLIEGSPRTFGTQATTIGSLADAATGLQFLSVPSKFDPTYQIEIKRDGILYIFGPKKTTLHDGVGDDAPKWTALSNFVNGSGIQATYQRKVTAGEKIRLHGYEWSIASEQIDVLDPASSEATTAVGLVDAELTQMLKSNEAIFLTDPELKAYLQVAQGAEQDMLTQLGNVDQEKVGLYYAALDKTQKMTLAAIGQSTDAQLIASARQTARQIEGLEESLNEIDELRNPDAVDSQTTTAPPTETASSLLGGSDHSVGSSTTEAPHPVTQDKFTNSIGMTMIPISAGSFQMGSPTYESGRVRDETLHKVTLTKSFFIERTDVTVGQFTQFETATGHQTAAEKLGFGNVYDVATKKWTHVDGLSVRAPGYPQTDDYPAVFINWNEARAFCQWLSLKENAHYRLPTEAEWEYACRAGTTTAFNTGDGDAAFTAAGWADQSVHPVALKQPSAWGLYDMHGNVRQWCSDIAASYPSTDVVDPTGAPDGNRPVTRGGDSWKSPNRCRSAARSISDHVGWADHSIGFRVVMESSAPGENQNTVTASPVSKPAPLPEKPAVAQSNPQTAPPADAITNSIGMKLLPLSPGEFSMGNPEGQVGHLHPEVQHQVTLTSHFSMGVFPVTRHEFQAFVDDTGFKTDAEQHGTAYAGHRGKDPETDGISWKNPGFDQTDGEPVTTVTWDDAKAFCAWLSKKEGRTYRLPTEAEWEYACRAGTQTAFYNGDDFNPLVDVGWYRRNSDKRTHPVGQKTPNAWGLYDMIGNVSQWCEDWQGAYTPQATTDPKGPPSGALRMTRGGSWFDTVRPMRSAARLGRPSDYRSNAMGFRIVAEGS